MSREQILAKLILAGLSVLTSLALAQAVAPGLEAGLTELAHATRMIP
jgi:hypothetical protein